MPGQPKRQHDMIDLTDEPPQRPAKASRLSDNRRMLPPPTPASNLRLSNGGPVYPAYVPHASQVVRDEEEEEHGNVLIDLTQLEDNIRIDYVPVGMIGENCNHWK